MRRSNQKRGQSARAVFQVDPLEGRLMLAGTGKIWGFIFDDVDLDGVFRSSSTEGRPGWTVFLDINGDGALSAGEPSAITTAPPAQHTFSNLDAGAYTVRVVTPPGMRSAEPRMVTVADGQTVRVDIPMRPAEYHLVSPVSEPFAISSNSPGDSSVAMNASGEAVVVWHAVGGASGIFGRRFSPAGEPLGPEFVVNATTTGGNCPAVAMDDSGQFAVVWSGSGVDGSGIYARRYDGEGNALGNETLLAAVAATGSLFPVVGMAEGGTFVAVWQGVNGSGIWANRYDASTGQFSGVYQVNDVAASTTEPAIAMRGSGEFIIAWQSFTSTNVHARRYDSAGQPLGGSFAVTTRSSAQYWPDVAMDDAGNVMVVWTDNGTFVANQTPIQAYNSLGQPITQALPVIGQVSFPRVEMRSLEHHVIISAGGNIRVTDWGSTRTIGVPLGAHPQVGMDAEGGFLVSWPASGAQMAQRFRVAKGPDLVIAAELQAADAFRIARLGDEMLVYPNTPMAAARPGAYAISGLDSVRLNGAGGDDSLTLDFSNGSPLPASGMTWDGGAGIDALVITGAGSIDCTPGQAWLLVDGVRIELIGVESVSFTGARLAVSGSEQDDTIIIQPAGAGLVRLAGAMPLAFSDSTILAFDGAGGDDVIEVEDAAAVKLQAGSALAALRLKGSARVSLASDAAPESAAPGGTPVLLTRELAIDANATLDIGETAIILRGQPSAIDAIRPLVAAARAGGLWSGVGIRSSGLDAGMELAALVNDCGDGSPLCDSLGGVELLADDILVRRALAGDLDLSGVIDGDDYFRLDLGHLQQLPGWLGGDINSDGWTDAADYFAADSAFLGQIAAAQTVTAAALPQWPTAQQSALPATHDEDLLVDEQDVLA